MRNIKNILVKLPGSAVGEPYDDVAGLAVGDPYDEVTGSAVGDP